MASSIIHLCVAKEILKELNLTEEKFLFGNILPDFSNIENDHDARRKITHFEKEIDINNIKICVPNLNEVRKIINSNNIDSIELGVFSHLYTDMLWAYLLVERHKEKIKDKIYIKTIDGLINDGREIIYKDYDSMNKEIIDRYKIDINFIKKCKYEGTFKEIYNKDTDSIYEIMSEHMKKLTPNNQLKIFTMGEMYEFIYKAKDEILEELRLILGENNVR